MIRVTTAAVLALAGTALAQYEITIDVESPTLLPGESTTVTMWAGFDRADHAFAGLQTNVVTSVGSEGFSDAMPMDPLNGPGTSGGSPSATGYDGIIAGQLHILGGYYADTSNPIAFWQATYTAPAESPAPFSIDLSTRTTRYDIYFHELLGASESHLFELVEGSATIHVIPAPASALVLAGGLLAMCRRR